MQTFNLDVFLQNLEYLVNIDSHAEDISGVTKVGKYYADLFDEKFFVREVQIDPSIAPGLLITNTQEEKYDLLLMAHMDTVFHAGEAAKRPFKNDGERLTGPGVNDMKSGGLLGCYAMINNYEELKKLKIALAFNPEEEMGSRHVRPWFEELSKKSSYVIVLEPARGNGAHVEARKGVGKYFINFHGVASHAGTHPVAGRSAIHEMGYWVCRLVELHNLETGFTVNVGTVKGGVNPNVVADFCEMAVDVRMETLDQIAAWDTLLEELQEHAFSKDINVEIIGGVNRPPMFKTAQTYKFIELCNRAAASLGMDCKWVKTGGGSDGNFSGALGVPTVDAFGPTGDGSHTVNEYVEVKSIAPAYELLVKIMLLLQEKIYG